MTILISDRRKGMTRIRASAKDIPVLRPVWRRGMLTCSINLCLKCNLTRELGTQCAITAHRLSAESVASRITQDQMAQF